MVGDGEAGQPELDGPLDQVVRGRGAVEEREVGVAWSSAYGVVATSIASGPGRREGARQYRTNVLSWRRETIKWASASLRHARTHHLDRPIRPVAMTALRTALAVVVAMLLILVLLPAVLAVQAASDLAPQ